MPLFIANGARGCDDAHNQYRGRQRTPSQFCEYDIAQVVDPHIDVVAKIKDVLVQLPRP